MKKIILFLMILMLVLQTSFTLAKNLGMIGPLYPIAETDFLQWIHMRLQEKIQSGEFENWQVKQIQAIKNSADRPAPVIGLTPTMQTRSWLYNPTLTLTHNLLDAQGRVRMLAGTRLNPLDQITWTKTLLFYDGDDPAQMAWAKKMNQQLKGQVLLILTEGSISFQTQQLKQRVYFDQGGHLVQRFGITHVPASVSQEGKQLRIIEVKL